LNDDPATFAGVKLLWFEGLASLRRGEPDAAPKLRQAFDGLVKHGAYVNAATCALDLAQAHLDAGDKASAFAVAGLVFPVPPVSGILSGCRGAQANVMADRSRVRRSETDS
jgi:hypothetical protein